MQCKAPDKRLLAELKDLNAGFLALITDPGLTWHGPLLGLNAGLIAGIRALSPNELDFVAATPCPLAGFSTLVAPGSVAEAGPDIRPVDAAWQEAVSVFATELIMYQWQMARQHPLVARMCISPGAGQVRKLAAMTFGDIQAFTRPALHRLEARFAGHTRFWPDLLKAAHSADREFRTLTRLAIIPLSVAEGRTTVRC
jgi:hypothetical protein